MTKVTDTKIARRWRQIGKHEFETREQILKPEERKSVGPCRFCGEPVYVSNGQLISWVAGQNGEHLYSHKKCRKGRD